MRVNPVFFKFQGRNFQEKRRFNLPAASFTTLDTIVGTIFEASRFKGRFTLTGKRLRLKLNGRLNLSPSAAVPGLPEQFPSVNFDVLRFKADILVNGKAVLDRRNRLVARDFKAKKIRARLTFESLAPRQPLFGLEAQLAFVRPVRLNREINGGGFEDAINTKLDPSRTTIRSLPGVLSSGALAF